MTVKRCDLCGHYFENQQELENHIDTYHATGLDKWIDAGGDS